MHQQRGLLECHYTLSVHGDFQPVDHSNDGFNNSLGLSAVLNLRDN